MDDPLTEFLIQLAGVGVGAGIAIASTLWWDRKKKLEAEEDTRKVTIKSILQEMGENKKGMEKFLTQPPDWDKTNKKWVGDWGRGNLSAFASAVNAGNFLLLPIESQTPVGDHYHHLELFNEFIKQIINFSSYHYVGAEADIEAKKILNYTTQEGKQFLSNVNELISNLEKAIGIESSRDMNTSTTTSEPIANIGAPIKR